MLYHIHENPPPINHQRVPLCASLSEVYAVLADELAVGSEDPDSARVVHRHAHEVDVMVTPFLLPLIIQIQVSRVRIDSRGQISISNTTGIDDLVAFAVIFRPDAPKLR